MSRLPIGLGVALSYFLMMLSAGFLAVCGLVMSERMMLIVAAMMTVDVQIAPIHATICQGFMGGMRLCRVDIRWWV